MSPLSNQKGVLEKASQTYSLPEDRNATTFVVNNIIVSFHVTVVAFGIGRGGNLSMQIVRTTSAYTERTLHEYDLFKRWFHMLGQFYL